MFLKWIEKHCGKRRNYSLQAIFPFSHIVFKRLVLQTSENKGLFRKGLKVENIVSRGENAGNIMKMFSFSNNVFKSPLHHVHS